MDLGDLTKPLFELTHKDIYNLYFTKKIKEQKVLDCISKIKEKFLIRLY